MMTIWLKLGLLSILIHVLFLYAIFDIFYVSPVITGLPAYPPSFQSPAKRLVLFVSDGLRAHSFFEHIRNKNDSFLRSVMESWSWGVSHTHVPTESRPGHVALIAGVLEDVSAVTRGWSENPVQFDSVFNRSTYTFSWGSADILPMFTKGAVDNHVYTDSYSTDKEDFGDPDAYILDGVVFLKVQVSMIIFQHFLDSAKSDAVMRAKLEERGVVLFLHLLDVDTYGHAYTPTHKDYIKNIDIVDKGIANMTRIITDFYGDNDTVFLFTSDHGMTDWGSHGAGSEHETIVPLVAWGSGVSRAHKHNSIHLHEWTWNDYVERGKNVQQVDIAPLMSCLNGLPVPTNSMGLLPAAYLDLNDRQFFSCAYANFQQMKAQMEYLQDAKKKHTFKLLFTYFHKLTPKKLTAVMSEIDKLIQQRRFKVAADLCLKWVAVLREGCMYYHRYEVVFLSMCLSLCFTSWILFLTSVLFALPKMKRKLIPTVLHVPSKNVRYVCLPVALLLWLQSLPLSNYVYCCTPLLLSDLAVQNMDPAGRIKQTTRLFGYFVMSFIMILPIVLEFFHRSCITFTLVLMAVWPCLDSNFVGMSLKRKLVWCGLCFVNVIFPCLPTIGEPHHVIRLWYAPLALILYLLYTMKNRSDFVLPIVLLVTVINSCYVRYTVSSALRIPYICHVISKIVLFISPVIPLFTRKNLYSRMKYLVLCLFLPLILMSLTYETCFYLCYALLLYYWIEMESVVTNCDWKRLEYDSDVSSDLPILQLELTDWRRAYFSLYFMFLAFFGTGNLASLNSFNLSFTDSFTTQFNPFIMGALLLMKILIPMVIPSFAMCALEMVSARSTMEYLLMNMIFADSMSLVFFFLLKDSGSWLDIGTSISHYVICIISTVFVLVMHSVAKFLLTVKLSPNDLYNYVYKRYTVALQKL